MKLKRKSLILLIMLFCFVGIGNVNAETDYSINTSPFTGTGGAYDNGNYEIFGNLGYRVTVVKITNYTESNLKYKVLAKKDYISHNARYGPNCTGSTCKNTANFYIADKKRNRYAVLKSGIGTWKNKGTSNSYLKSLTTTDLLDSSKINGSYKYDWSKVSTHYTNIAKSGEANIKAELKKLGVKSDEYTKISYKYKYTCPSGYTFSDGKTTMESGTELNPVPTCVTTTPVNSTSITVNGKTSTSYYCPEGYSWTGTISSTTVCFKNSASTAKKETCKESQLSDVYLLIEPMFTVGKGSPQRTYYGTATELYKLGGFSGKYKNWASLIYTSKNKYGETAQKPFGNFLKKATVKEDSKCKKNCKQVFKYTSLGDYKGYALGVIWMGNDNTTPKTCDDTPLTCDDGSGRPIQSCVDDLEKKGIGTQRAIEICNVAECDKLSCEYTNCEGRKTVVEMGKDKIIEEMVAYSEKTAEDVRSDFENANCPSDCCKVDQSSDTLKCNRDIEVKGTISQNFDDATGGTETTCGTTYGDLVNGYQTTNGCDIYCIQKVDFNLPGNVNEIIKKGTSFKWPSLRNDRLNSYKMNIKSEIVCTVVNRNNPTASGSCGSITDDFVKNSIISDEFIYENTSSYSMESWLTYYDDKYAVTNEKLSKENTNISCDGCGDVNDGSKFTVTVTSDYKLPQTLNKFINSTGEFSRNDSLSLLELDEGVLAVYKDARYPKYDLKLTFDIGFNNEIGSKITNYVCHYRVSDDSDDCVCPEGTKNAGKDISTLADCMNKICVEAQSELCDKDVIDENVYDQACICKYNHKTVDIFNSNCYKTEEHSFEYCYNYLCNDSGFCTDNCTWDKKVTNLNNGKQLQEWNKTCTNGNKTENCGYQFTCLSCGDIKSPEECDMNPTPCIQTKLKYQNLSYALKENWITPTEFQRALIACEQVVCPSGGKKIIYRVIDLNDPFPGMSAKPTSGVQNINDNVNGRYPGYNWNNVFWVENKIRNVKAHQRNVENYNLYNEKPLYTIELTPQNINDIRRYNKTHEYTDWSEFICENGKCMSDFLRKSEYNDIFKSGLCKNVSNVAELKNCYENYSSSSIESNYKH